MNSIAPSIAALNRLPIKQVGATSIYRSRDPPHQIRQQGHAAIDVFRGR
jgi:hypothetical protein